jgi:hypothetical protein
MGNKGEAAVSVWVGWRKFWLVLVNVSRTEKEIGECGRESKKNRREQERAVHEETNEAGIILIPSGHVAAGPRASLLATPSALSLCTHAHAHTPMRTPRLCAHAYIHGQARGTSRLPDPTLDKPSRSSRDNSRISTFSTRAGLAKSSMTVFEVMRRGGRPALSATCSSAACLDCKRTPSVRRGIGRWES